MRSGNGRMQRRGVDRSRSRSRIRAIALRHHRLRFRFMLRFMLLWLCLRCLSLLLILVACKHSACVLLALERDCKMGRRREQATEMSCPSTSHMGIIPKMSAFFRSRFVPSGRGAVWSRLPGRTGSSANPFASFAALACSWVITTSFLPTCNRRAAFQGPATGPRISARSRRCRPMSTAADTCRRKHARTPQA